MFVLSLVESRGFTKDNCYYAQRSSILQPQWVQNFLST